MEAINFIREVETKYDVKSIKIKGMEVWPFLRALYAYVYAEKYDLKDRETKLSLWARIKKVKNIFYGFPNLFKKYDYLVFSNMLERRVRNGKYINKLAEVLLSELGRKKTLLIEDPVKSRHLKHSEISTENIISLDFFLCLGYLPSLLKRRFTINNGALLQEINKKYNLNINYRTQISRFICYRNFFRFFFKIYKPKLIFTSQYYGTINQTVIYAAKESGIKVIELQHGCINDEHFAYHVFTDLDKSFFPDYLFVFGDYVKDIVGKNNYFIRKENIISVGNMYIDYINNEYKPSKETIQKFNDFRKKYRKIVAISSQWTLEDKLIDFLKKSALLSRDILYIFVPRDLNKDYLNANFPENIIILKDLNVYQVIKEVDIHSTMWSTCALEAPALGVPNILINIDGFAKKHYLDLLTNQDVTKFVNSPEEFVEMILNWHPKPKEEIKTLHSGFYKQNYKASLKQALKKVFGIKYQICKRCIMDTTVPDIKLDDGGVCNYCSEYTARLKRWEKMNKKELLNKLLKKIKEKGRNQRYDCLVGVSGGLDSSYAFYAANKLGLRPLAVHLDNGWNTKLSENNISKLINKFNVDLYRYTPDGEEFRDLQRAFFKANVVDIEMLTDNAITALLYKVAREKRIKYILTGGSIVSEGMKMPPGWLHMKFDLKNIRAICGKFAGKKDFQTVPVIGWFQYFKYQYLDGIKQIPILNYLSYDKKKVTEVLSREVGWEPYEKKHYESLFTRFYQGYILPRKFNIDKRKVHYSTLICSGQIGREEALESMKKEPYEDNLSLERDKEYVLKKLGFSKEEFERYLSSPSVPHTFYPSSERIYKIYKLLQKVRKMLVSK